MSGPLIGVFFHWLGGFSSASFYVPYRGVRSWSWEVYWLTGGFISWVIAPWLFAWLLTENLLGVLATASNDILFWCYTFGVAWGFGGLTFGLTLRYLGLSLGMAVALGLTTAFGTLIPPVYEGTLLALTKTIGGQLVLIGVAVALFGIVLVALAGKAKERELPEAQRRAAIAEFDFVKGMATAIFSGIMSACFAYGLAAGKQIRELALAAGTDPLNQGLPVLCVILAGGFTTNVIWCSGLIYKNKTLGQFLGRLNSGTGQESGFQSINAGSLSFNYLLCTVAGFAWYFQFFFYTMGESQMGQYSFSSWTLHMASIIIFSTLWGFFFNEWKGVSRRTFLTVCTGIATLVLSTIIIGWGNTINVAATSV